MDRLRFRGVWCLSVGPEYPLLRLGFVSFLASNGCWIGFAVLTNAPGLFYMQVAFTGTSLLGIYRWVLVKPKAAAVRNERPSDVIYNPREFRARKFKGSHE